MCMCVVRVGGMVGVKGMLLCHTKVRALDGLPSSVRKPPISLILHTPHMARSTGKSTQTSRSCSRRRPADDTNGSLQQRSVPAKVESLRTSQVRQAMFLLDQGPFAELAIHQCSTSPSISPPRTSTFASSSKPAYFAIGGWRPSHEGRCAHLGLG